MGEAGGFECVRPGTFTKEECCNHVHGGEKWNYNYLKQVCRDACFVGSYFDEEANQCVFADGVECFDVPWNLFLYPEDGLTIGATSEWCCHNVHDGDKSYYNYFTYRCVSSCLIEEHCVRPPPSEPETPLFNVPTCVDASQYADCTLCPEARVGCDIWDLLDSGGGGGRELGDFSCRVVHCIVSLCLFAYRVL